MSGSRIFVMLDRSSSMQKWMPNILAFVKLFPVEDTQLVLFDETCALTSTPASELSLRDLTTDKKTNFHTAFMWLQQQFPAKQGAEVQDVVVISDGLITDGLGCREGRLTHRYQLLQTLEACVSDYVHLALWCPSPSPSRFLLELKRVLPHTTLSSLGKLDSSTLLSARR